MLQQKPIDLCIDDTVVIIILEELEKIQLIRFVKYGLASKYCEKFLLWSGLKENK